MPRPRKVSDEEVFEATQRVMTRVGPGDLSLAEIASEVGVTPGALVQRFGSKRDLLLAVVERWADGTEAILEAFRGRRPSPLDVVRHWAECMAGMGETPASLANHLAYLQMDLTDPDFRRHMKRNADVTRVAFERWLEEAVAAGELAGGTDVVALARLVEATIAGSLLSWAVHQEGTARAWVVRDVDALIGPHVPGYGAPAGSGPDAFVTD